MTLYELLPDASVLLDLEPEELAGFVLQHLNSESQTDSPPLSRANFAGMSAVRDYPSDLQKQVQHALMEAWAWLMREGFLALGPGPIGEFAFVTRRGRRVADPDALTKARRGNLLPRAQLHPLVAEKVWPAFLRGEYDTAIFQAFREVEIAVRTRADLDQTIIGTLLMRKAFDPTSGPLSDMSLPKAEREAMANLFAGAIGLFKNPHSHRHVTVEAENAAEVIAFASHLLRVVDSA